MLIFFMLKQNDFLAVLEKMITVFPNKKIIPVLSQPADNIGGNLHQKNSLIKLQEDLNAVQAAVLAQ